MRWMTALGCAALALACSDAPETTAPRGPQENPHLTEVAIPGAGAEGWPDGTGLSPEIMGPGVALADLDGDGRLDLVRLTMPLPGSGSAPLGRVLLQDASGDFRDAGPLPASGYAQGVTVGDVDGDGLPDLFLTNYGPDKLLFNRGAGRFEPAAGPGGWDQPLWSSSAAFCDYDGDGDLDLYVAHYLADGGKTCLGPTGTVGYCAPQVFAGIPDRLYRNDGSGRFEDATDAAGLVSPDGGRRAKGLGVTCADLTGDGLLDFYVANDGESNQLWTNLGDGRLADEAALRGVAVNRHGDPEASMGIAVGDIDGDLGLDVALTHLEGENNTIYGGSLPGYRDQTPRAGMAMHDFGLTGFGCALIDLELDGDLDFVVVNGKVRRSTSTQVEATGFWDHYAEPNQVYENDGSGGFVDASARETGFASPIEVTRGLAYGDIDDDGDVDLVVSNADNALRLYRNDAPRSGNRWLRVEALSGGGPALGARVTIHGGGRSWKAVVPSGASYASASDPRLIFGLGRLETIERIEVVWPDGSREAFPGSDVDKGVVVRRGEGSPA